LRSRIEVHERLRRSRKPLPKREPPACGPVVRVIRGKSVEHKAED
jgi:hypothetical protein